MNIDFKETRDTVEFRFVNPGETFSLTTETNVYFKIENSDIENNCFNAVDMATGDACYFNDLTLVILLQNKLTVWY